MLSPIKYVFCSFTFIVRVIPSILIDNTYNWLMCIISTFCIDERQQTFPDNIFFCVCTLYLVLHVIPFIGKYNWQNKSTINLNKEPGHLLKAWINNCFSYSFCIFHQQNFSLKKKKNDPMLKLDFATVVLNDILLKCMHSCPEV